MPLVAQGALAYALGLFAALGASVGLAIGVLIAASWASFVFVRTGRSGAASSAALVAAGALVGLGSGAATRRCRERLAAMPEWTAELTGPAGPRANLRATLWRDGPRGRATP